MYERALYEFIILYSIDIAALNEQRLKLAHTISVLVLVLILILG